MPERLRRAKVFRDRAEELRTIAHMWPNDEATRMLADVARDYERMADQLEQVARVDGIVLR